MYANPNRGSSRRFTRACSRGLPSTPMNRSPPRSSGKPGAFSGLGLSLSQGS